MSTTHEADRVRVVILPNEDGEAAWLVLATDGDDPADLDSWQAEISRADWQRFDDAQKALGDVITLAVDASPRDEDGAWSDPCASFYSWKFDSPMAKTMLQEQLGEPSALDLCSRCRHTRIEHKSEHER